MSTLALPQVNWRLAGTIGLVALALPVMVLMAIEGQVRIPLAAAVAFPLLALAAANVRAAIVVAMVFLILLGDIRRALIPIAGWSGMDPLLLVGPAFALLVSAMALGTGTLRLDTTLSKWAAALMIIMALQIFNPLQGGLAVGVAGIIFLMAPLFWFWVGRSYATPALMRTVLFGVIIPLGLAATAFGFYQRFFGYLPYQMDWYWIAGYGGLGNLETGLAPITFFASGTEHGSFLVTTGVVLWAVFLRHNRAVAIALVPVLIGVVLTGSRGPVAKLLAMMAVMWAVLGEDRRAWIPRFGVALVVLAAGLIWSLNQSATMVTDAEVQRNIQRQSQLFGGTAEEEVGQESTVSVHLTLLLHGYQHLLTRPLGAGLGATSSAATKFGGQSMSTETDLGDVMVATGIAGALVYHVMIVLVALTAIRYWRLSQTTLALTLVGLLGSHFLLWLGGGLYAVSSIVWLCIGALDALERDRSRQAALMAAPAPTS